MRLSTTNSSSFSQTILARLLKNPVVVDVETTITAKGNCFNYNNRLVTIQLKQGDSPPIILTKENFHESVAILAAASVVIGFNLKFDLAWLQRELGFKAQCVWCCQLAEFIFSSQTWKYPDLNTTLLNYGFQPKLDIVKTEYWEKGIDTDQIPIEILSEYGAYDVEGTYSVFCKQVERFQTDKEHQFRLFRLHCNDLLVLQEMEFNGIVYDEAGSLGRSQELQKQVDHVEGKLNAYFDNTPINFGSGDQISAILYGGTISQDVRVPIGVYKSGAKTGQPRCKIVTNEYKFPRLVEPLKNSQLKKEGVFSTDEPTLLSLKPTKDIKRVIDWLLERSKMLKLRSTYLEGLPNTIMKMGWNKNMLHSNLNQCVATTGRLSSTKPNSQNLPKEAKEFCVSRYS